VNLFAVQEVLRFGFSLVEVPAGDGIGEPLHSETDVAAPDPCRGPPASPGREPQWRKEQRDNDQRADGGQQQRDPRHRLVNQPLGRWEAGAWSGRYGYRCHAGASRSSAGAWGW
jgi:hypothetical protein